MVLVRGRKIVADAWRHVEDGEPLPDAGPITISWARWLAKHDAIERTPAEFGVRIPNTLATADIGADTISFGLIVLTFPNIGDGRAYSQARVLRGQYGFTGEIRATGAILRDQLQLMERCGIDAFALPDRAVAEDWLSAFTEYDLFYQPAEDNRPWIARQRLRRN
jgi:uncharacterized protein (DUF934 family)